MKIYSTRINLHDTMLPLRSEKSVKVGIVQHKYVFGQLTQKGCIFRLNTPGLPKGQSDFGLSSLRLTMPNFAEAANALPGSCLLITQAGRQVKLLSKCRGAIMPLFNALLNFAVLGFVSLSCCISPLSFLGQHFFWTPTDWLS